MDMGSTGPISVQVPFVETKVRAGIKLNERELEFVKKHEPELYQKAVKIETDIKVHTYNEKGTFNTEPDAGKVLIDV